MTERERLCAILDQIALHRDEYLVSGSGAMVLQGMERELNNDIDIYTSTRAWFELQRTGAWDLFTTEPEDPKRRCDPPYLYRMMRAPGGDPIEVNIFYAWRRRSIGDIDTAFWMANAVIVQGGFRCVPLQFVLDVKEELGRAKDQVDIESIKAFMA